MIGRRILPALAAAALVACTFPDVDYAGSGGASATPPAMGGGGATSTSATSTSAASGCSGRCELPHASSRCSGATCIVDTCDANYADCNKSPADGCEVDLHGDDLHCGSCNVVCIWPDTCKGGKCK